MQTQIQTLQRLVDLRIRYPALVDVLNQKGPVKPDGVADMARALPEQSFKLGRTLDETSTISLWAQRAVASFQEGFASSVFSRLFGFGFLDHRNALTVADDAAEMSMIIGDLSNLCTYVPAALRLHYIPH